MARRDGFVPHALTIDYGQRHRAELTQAAVVARALQAAEHRVVALDLRSIGGSALTADLAVPKDRSPSDASVPITYVPARNTIFLGLALGWAEVLGAADLYLGANAVDYSGYPDCRPAFIEAFERLAAVATVAGVNGAHFQVHAPLLRLTKAEIIRHGMELGVDYGLTHSCYDPDAQGRACGHCDSCALRRKGFAEAGVPDPTRYVAE
jgi:7-cyano-7-deazaguanine synthase